MVLSGLDHDHGLSALGAFRDLIKAEGHDLPHIFAFPSNAGVRMPQTDPARVAELQGFGPFPGARALALLSRYPIDTAHARDFSHFLWRDLPSAMLPETEPDWTHHQRLSSTGHWDVPVQLNPTQRINLLIYQAGPPVFGTEKFSNLNRNHDETAFWSAYLDALLPMPPPSGPFAVMGGSNLDPFDGDGRKDAIRALLNHPKVTDPAPSSDGARQSMPTPQDLMHEGAPEYDTVHWPQANGPGNLRVSYILPSADLVISGAGVFWPTADSPDAGWLGDQTSPPTAHRLVWVDIDRASIAARSSFN
jgi:hypothetical protein